MSPENFLYVLTGLVLGISVMLVFMGFDVKDRTVVWIGVFGLLIGGYLFITV